MNRHLKKKNGTYECHSYISVHSTICQLYSQHRFSTANRVCTRGKKKSKTKTTTSPFVLRSIFARPLPSPLPIGAVTLANARLQYKYTLGSFAVTRTIAWNGTILFIVCVGVASAGVLSSWRKLHYRPFVCAAGQVPVMPWGPAHAHVTK